MTVVAFAVSSIPARGLGSEAVLVLDAESTYILVVVIRAGHMRNIEFADSHLVLSAAANAEQAALRLFSVGSAVYPGDNENLVNHFIREAIEAGVTLGLHARKLIELCHLEDANITQARWAYDGGQHRENSFREGTNRFVHARSLKIRTLQYPERVFGSDVVKTDFIITTDRREEAYIDIFGFAWAYLSNIAPQIAPSS